MSESNRDVPQFALSTTIRMDPALAIIEATRVADPAVRLTPTAVIVAAATAALAEHPRLNACWEDGELYLHDDIHIGVAVAVEGGLIAPTLLDSSKLTLPEIATRLHDLVRRAKDARLRSAELTAATFTISNLGMFDVSSFTALVVPPQVAILAVSSITTVPVLEGETWEQGRVLTATISCDHRAVDGADAAKYLQTLKRAVSEIAI
jgi:pyruvate dehydrogenase E2 component (dihydrolipoamide acetyltransferase)